MEKYISNVNSFKKRKEFPLLLITDRPTDGVKATGPLHPPEKKTLPIVHRARESRLFHVPKYIVASFSSSFGDLVPILTLILSEGIDEEKFGNPI